ncbi:hypothetical protein HYH02_004573 [Chlamydomonas schloesseri]|uniref:Uncharacterized protein n=1 Tax=Chlamydomonas schloesseri TaxID=2026947 RepID=A0A835WQB5_9CHLO|nr:hypothetical protein HYH02_004573 [Chlamydomonas schloesseri]|eukprot:KAG2450735.1 hypothetical protein HYH02_004573 [Chlamydomonas schloesseri]
MLPPGLHRAISDAVSPFGAYPSADVLRNLEVYLSDSRSTDAVYDGLVSRACAEPLSLPLVEKVVGLLKAYVLSCPPGPELLGVLDEFCQRVAELPAEAGLSGQGRKAVQYVRSCLRQIKGGDRLGLGLGPGLLGAGRASQGSLAATGSGGGSGGGGGGPSFRGSLRGSLGRSRDDLSNLSRLAGTGSGGDGRGGSGLGGGSVIKLSVSASSLTGAGSGRPPNDRYAAAEVLSSPSGDAAAAAGATVPSWLRQSDGRGGGVGGKGYEDLRLPPPQQAALGVEPAWAVPARPLQLPPPPAGATAARARMWLQHLPDLAPRLALPSGAAAAAAAAAAAGAQPGAALPNGSTSSGSSVLGNGSGAGAAGGGSSSAAAAAAAAATASSLISLGTIHRAVLDLEEADIGRHLGEVLGEARVEAQASAPVASQPRQAARGGGRAGGVGGAGGAGGAGGLGARRGRPARLLFHHPPYNRSEQLPMTEADVAVVVEAVCGVRAASALAAVAGPPGSAAAAAAAAAEEEAAAAAAAAGAPEGMWQASFDEDADFAQMCGSILMKLIIDMWQRCGPVGSYTLVLRMLRAALRSSQPSTRARAFDVLYNLSVHGAMLRGESEEAALAAAAAEAAAEAAANGGAGVPLPWQVCASAPVSPFISGGGGAGAGLTPPPAPRGGGAAGPTTPLATPEPPGAAGPGGPPARPRHVASHSLGLSNSALLDSAQSMSAAAQHQHHHHTLQPAAAASSLTGTMRKVASTGRSTLVPGGAVAVFASSSATDAPPPSTPPPALPAPSLGGGGVGAAGAQGPGQAAAGAGAGGAGGLSGPGEDRAVYDRWLRALLFQLLCDLCEHAEYAEEVWRAAMGATSQLCSHGGHWVAARVVHLPPAALAGLLRAACNLAWSQELYGHLLRLVPQVLVPPPPPPPPPAAAAAAGGSAASTPSGGSGPSATARSAFAAPAALGSAAVAAEGAPSVLLAGAAGGGADGGAVAARLAAFGGLEELLFHFMRAPTPDSRAALLAALAYCCYGGGGGAAAADAGGDRPPQLQLPGGASPAAGGAAGSGTSPGGGRGGGPDGAAAVLGLLQVLHLDSVCQALRAALQRPWPGMSSRLADVLASAVAEAAFAAASGASAGAASTFNPYATTSSASSIMPPSPSGGLGAAAEAAYAATLPAGVASPIAARALLRPLLESLEVCCADSMTSPQGSLRTHMEVSLAHISGGSGGGGLNASLGLPLPLPPPALSAASVGAAWRAFKEVCCEESAEARQMAIHWLHKLLSAACRAVYGQLLLLSPLSLKTSPEANKVAAAAAVSAAAAAAAAAGHSSGAPLVALPQWNIALADALLHVVREAPLGCELLMAAISRVAADQKAAAAAAAASTADSAAGAPVGTLGGTFGGGAGAVAAAAAAAGDEAAMAACRRVMRLYYVALQWMLQCGSAEARTPAVVELADTVLTALLQPDPAAAAAVATAAAAAGAASGGAGGSAGAAAGGGSATSAAADRPPLPGSAGGGAARAAPPRGSSSILSQLPQAAAIAATPAAAGPGGAAAAVAAAAVAVAAAAQLQSEPGGGMLVSQQLLSGLLAFDADALACTPPELLVTLLQQCSQTVHDAAGGGTGAGGGSALAALANGGDTSGLAGADGDDEAGRSLGSGGFASMRRGFVGRPCAVSGGGAAAALPLQAAAAAAAAAAASTSGRGPARASGAGFPVAAATQDGSGSAGGVGGVGGALLSGAAVGPWQDDWQDRRLALLLLLMARCSLDPEAFAKYSLSHVIKAQLSCEDLRCRYYAGVYLLKHWMLNQHDRYWRSLRHIIGTAQQLNDERLLDNPYLQMRTMLNVDHA